MIDNQTLVSSGHHRTTLHQDSRSIFFPLLSISCNKLKCETVRGPCNKAISDAYYGRPTVSYCLQLHDESFSSTSFYKSSCLYNVSNLELQTIKLRNALVRLAVKFVP